MSTFLAAVHGVGRAGVFRSDGGAVRVDRRWLAETSRRCPDTGHLRARALLASWRLVAAQIASGKLAAALRSPTGARSAHVFLALAVCAVAVAFCSGIETATIDAAVRWPSSRWRSRPRSLQIVLGIVAMIYLLPFDGIPTAGRLLSGRGPDRPPDQRGACSWRRRWCLNLRTCRHLAASTSGSFAWSMVDRRGRPRSAALDWEAVA